MKSLALTLALSVLLTACTTTVRREGEVLFMYCMLACVLRIDAANTQIEHNLRKALPLPPEAAPE